MDVRCRQCGTEYELDDARVALSGTTVKCSTCAHVFKVMPSGMTRDASGGVPRAPSTTPPTTPSQPPMQVANVTTPVMGTLSAPPPAPAASGEWMVRKQNGEVFRFRELTTLQKWIVERKVVRDDEISRTGKSWKKLGEIAELTSFFQVVEAADAAQRAVTASMMPQVHLTATPTGTFQAYPMQPGQPPPTLVEPAPPERPITLAAPLSSQRGEAEPANVLDGDDPVLSWQRRRRMTMAAAVVAAAVVAAVIFGVVLDKQSTFLRGRDTDGPARAATEQALRNGDVASITAARSLLSRTKSAAVPGFDARLAAEDGRARLLAAEFAEEAIALSIEGAGAASPARNQADVRLAEAKALITAVRAQQPDSVDANLAAATIALARGDSATLTSETNAGREHAALLSPKARADVDDELRLLLSLAELSTVGKDDVAGAAALLDKLARFDDVRARAGRAQLALVAVRTARTQALLSTEATRSVDQGAAEKARAALAALPEGDVRRSAGEALLTALTTLSPPPEAPKDPPPQDTPPPKDLDKPGETPTPVVDESFDALMSRGDKALSAGRSSSAYDAFKKATAKEPNNARAWLKLGWAALDSGKKGEAPRAFDKALSISPQLHEARFGLAEALRFAGRTDEAIAAYKRYLQDDPSGKDANIARNAIKQLE